MEELLREGDEKLRQARVILNSRDVPREVAVWWVAEATETIRKFMVELLRVDISTSLKQRLQSRVALLLSVRVKFRQWAQIVGGGHEAERPPHVVWEEVESAFASRLKTCVISNIGHIDVKRFIDDAEAIFVQRLEEELRKLSAVKVYVLLSCDYIKTGSIDAEIKTFNTKSAPIFQTTDIHEWYEENVRKPLLNDLDDFEDHGSGWILESILNLAVHINKYRPMVGSSYIPLPGPILMRKACINVQNNDECFRWAILSALHPTTSNPQRCAQYVRYRNELNFGDLVFPITPRDVNKFEKLNPNISVNPT